MGEKPRYVATADGRFGIPDVVLYETADGARHLCPPRNAGAYKAIVFNLAEYDRLFNSGWLYSDQHYGPTQPITDRKITS